MFLGSEARRDVRVGSTSSNLTLVHEYQTAMSGVPSLACDKTLPKWTETSIILNDDF